MNLIVSIIYKVKSFDELCQKKQHSQNLNFNDYAHILFSK